MKTIISIYPLARREIRGTFRPQTHWEIAAAPKGGFTRLQVEQQEVSDYAGHDRWLPRVITAEDIANDLVTCWTRGFVGQPANAQPGFWVSDIDNPTDEQVLASKAFKEAEAKQDRYFAAAVAQADALLRKNERGNINAFHHVAAEALGVTGRPWQEDLTKGQDCPFCKKKIAPDTLKCPHCSEIVDVERYAAIKREQEAVLSSGVQAGPPRPPVQPQRKVA